MGDVVENKNWAMNNSLLFTWFHDCLDKIQNGMNQMIDIYDRIDSYRNNADLAAYITNVGTIEPRFSDSKLNDKISDLNAILESNLVLQC